jgi:hypothetical protein
MLCKPLCRYLRLIYALRALPGLLSNAVTVSGIVNIGKPGPTAARIPVTNESQNVSLV